MVIFTPYTISVILCVIFVFIDLIFFIFILLFFTKWASYEFRAISSIILFGFCIIFVGAGVSHPEIVIFGIFPLSLSPILMIVGSLIFIAPMLVNVEYFSKARAI